MSGMKQLFQNSNNLNFNYGEFAMIESQKVLNKIAISQMMIFGCWGCERVGK